MERETLEKLYAGLIGMDAGMRLGAPVENPFWTYERLQSYYGDIRGYLREQRYYTADDDVNGPLIFVRALADNAMPETLAPETVGETWLNYTRRGMGMFWWGGEDVSTEHRAYMNLRRGVKAPRSGSIEENGKTAAEQIGGQIFVDTWGLICPGDPARAAELAAAAAWTARGLWPRASPRRIRRPHWTRCWIPVCASCRRSATTAAWSKRCAPTTAHTRRKRISAPAAR